MGKDTPSNNSKAGQQRCGRSKLSTTGPARRRNDKGCRFRGEAQKTLEIWKYVVLLVVLLELQCWSLTTEDLDRIHDSTFGDAIDLICFDMTRMILQALAAALGTQNLDEKEALGLLDDFYGGAKHMRPHV